jgi:hypothetical protein
MWSSKTVEGKLYVKSMTCHAPQPPTPRPWAAHQ